MSLIDAIKNEIIEPEKGISLTGLKPVDKVILSIIGVAGMGVIGLIAAVGLYKAPPLSTLSASKGYQSSKRMLKGLKLLWDMVEGPIIRWKPEYATKIRYVDQGFDFIQNFLDKEEIGSLFRSSSGY